MNPLDMALDTLKGHPSYDKRNLSDDAIRHKREYDTKYESTPERTKYRTDLKRERRQRGMMGHGGPDLSHTKRGGLVRENPHDNRARNQPGHTLKMLKFLPEQDAGSAFPRGSEEEESWWNTLQQLTAPDKEETETPSFTPPPQFPGMMVGDKWASTREEAEAMGAQFLPADRTEEPTREKVKREEDSGYYDSDGRVTWSDDIPGHEKKEWEGVSYGRYHPSGEDYFYEGAHEPSSWGGPGTHDNLGDDELLTHAKEFDKDGYAYMEKIGVPKHHQREYGEKLHRFFKNRLRQMGRKHMTQESMEHVEPEHRDAYEQRMKRLGL